MALRQIIPITDPRLKAPSLSVGEITAEIRTLAADMLETSRAIRGAGIAAVQVGVPIRLFVMDLSAIGGETITFVNPVVTFKSNEVVTRKEGCLSMPGVVLEVERPDAITVSYTDLDGNEFASTFAGYAGVAVQHEIDHLDGIRHIDHISPLKRGMALTAFAKSRKRGFRP